MAATGERRSAEITLPAQATSPSRARRFVSATLASWGLDGGDDAVLLVSELATNALLHARTEMTVSVEDEGETVRVCVSDRSSAVPQPRRFGVESGTGRGLRLLDTMAESWGTEVLDSGGKCVWFRVRLGADTAFAAFDVDAVEAL